MNAIWALPSAQFTTIHPAGFRLIAALHAAAQAIGHDLTITSACDGAHSGPEDPHHLGCAYDVRIHDLPDPQAALEAIMNQLGTPTPDSGGLVTAQFFGWIEQAGTPNSHIHLQLRHGQTYPSAQPPLLDIAE